MSGGGVGVGSAGPTVWGVDVAGGIVGSRAPAGRDDGV